MRPPGTRQRADVGRRENALVARRTRDAVTRVAEVRFVLYGEAAHDAFARALAALP